MYECPVCERDLTGTSLKSRVHHLKTCAKKASSSSNESLRPKKSANVLQKRKKEPTGKKELTSKFFRSEVTQASDKSTAPSGDDFIQTISKHKKTTGTKKATSKKVQQLIQNMLLCFCCSLQTSFLNRHQNRKIRPKRTKKRKNLHSPLWLRKSP